MERKRKVRRAFFLAFSIYIVINIFIFGLMKAYLNTNNIVSREQLVMASVNKDENSTEINILGRKITINESAAKDTVTQAAAYILLPVKARTCAEIIIRLSGIM
ncbi:MAG: hypothetical protein ACI4JB_01560 [Porcipelethomonas sp.]